MTVSKKQNETLIGIDYGTKNIGVALGKNGLTMPVKVISKQDINTALHEIIRIAMENKAERFVLGLPVTKEGKETRMSLETRRFGNMLKLRSRKPVVYHSEYSTSKEAHAQKAIFGYSVSRKTLEDHISAAITLKRYFDET